MTFSKNGVIEDTYGGIDIGEVGDLWYVVGSKVQTTYGNASFTGLADYSATDGNWYYITDGKVDYDCTETGIFKNKNGWWVVVDGIVDFDVDTAVNTTVNGTTAYWYISGGKVMTSYTGVADFKIDDAWRYIKNGQVNYSANTVAKNKNGWWCVKDGVVVFDDQLTAAAQFVGANTSSSASDSARMEAAFKALSKYSYKRYTYTGDPTASDMPTFAKQMFANKQGNCYRYAAAFAYIANALGYDSRVAVGKISSASGGMTPHGWTEVKVSGTWYICDANMQMNHQNINSYMRTESNYAYKHSCSARYTMTVSNGTVTWK